MKRNFCKLEKRWKFEFESESGDKDNNRERKRNVRVENNNKKVVYVERNMKYVKQANKQKWPPLYPPYFQPNPLAWVYRTQQFRLGINFLAAPKNETHFRFTCMWNKGGGRGYFNVSLSTMSTMSTYCTNDISRWKEVSFSSQPTFLTSYASTLRVSLFQRGSLFDPFVRRSIGQ